MFYKEIIQQPQDLNKAMMVTSVYVVSDSQDSLNEAQQRHIRADDAVLGEMRSLSALYSVHFASTTACVFIL